MYVIVAQVDESSCRKLLKVPQSPNDEVMDLFGELEFRFDIDRISTSTSAVAISTIA